MHRSKINVGVLGGNRIVREHLNRVLDKRSFVLVTIAVPPARASAQPDIVLIEARRASEANLHRLKKELPASPIVIIDVDTDQSSNIVHWLRLGVIGVVASDASDDQYASTIRSLAARTQTISRCLQHWLLKAPAKRKPVDPYLTEKERAVVRLVVEGKSNKEIAQLLGNTEGTVRTHMRHIFGKCGCRNRSHLAATAMERGWIWNNDTH